MSKHLRWALETPVRPDWQLIGDDLWLKIKALDSRIESMLTKEEEVPENIYTRIAFYCGRLYTLLTMLEFRFTYTDEYDDFIDICQCHEIAWDHEEEIPELEVV